MKIVITLFLWKEMQSLNGIFLISLEEAWKSEKLYVMYKERNKQKFLDRRTCQRSSIPFNLSLASVAQPKFLNLDVARYRWILVAWNWDHNNNWNRMIRVGYRVVSDGCWLKWWRNYRLILWSFFLNLS